jgi:hypothetical protein
MRSITSLLVASAFVAAPAFAQQAQGGYQGAQISGKSGVQIQGNTSINADQANTAAIAVGDGNTAKNTAGAIKGNTQIQGNTKINASQKNTAAVAVGKDNKASNEAGVIGGN